MFGICASVMVKQVQMALCRMRDVHDNPYAEFGKRILFSIWCLLDESI